MGGIRDYLMLLRIHTAGVTAAVLLSGALLSGLKGAQALSTLFISGVLLHSAGFALNEVADLPYDRRSPHLRHKPLVRGVIKRGVALLLAVALFTSALALFTLLKPSPRGVALLLLSSLLGISYDVFGKRLPFSDLLAAGWFSLLPLSSAISFSSPGDVLYLLSLYLFLQILYNNSVEGGLKDLESDLEGGGRGTLIFLGALPGELGRGALSYSLAVRGLLFVAPLLPPVLLDRYPLPLTLTIFALSSLLLALSVKTLIKTPGERGKLLEEFTLHEVGSFILFILLLVPYLPVTHTLTLLLLPPLWNLLFTKALYGRAGVPGV